jgi:hypothetical protein
LRVPLTGVNNQQYVTVALVTNVNAADGGCRRHRLDPGFGFLLGDVSQNRVVTLSDPGQRQCASRAGRHELRTI